MLAFVGTECLKFVRVGEVSFEGEESLDVGYEDSVVGDVLDSVIPCRSKRCCLKACGLMTF